MRSKDMILTIDALGSQGDGIAGEGRERVYVPFTLPGEQVKVTGSPPNLQLVEIVDSSSDRVEPLCQHFGTCGGCTMQHLAQKPYLSWKAKRVHEAFSSQGIKTKIDPCIGTEPASRRRAVFSATRSKDGMQFGFNESGSHELVDLVECPILDGSISAAFPSLRNLIKTILRGKEVVQLAVTACENGLDVAIMSQAVTAN